MLAFYGTAMLPSRAMRISDFDYDLPDTLIAQRPLPQRSDSRLLYLPEASDTHLDNSVHNLPMLLRPGDLLILNDTKVIPARLLGRKSTGGKVEVLIERMLDLNLALCHVRASKAPQASTLLIFDGEYTAYVLRREDRFFCIGVPRSG